MIEYIDKDFMPAVERAEKSGELGPLQGRLEHLAVQLGNADPGFMDFAMGSELLKGGTSSVHFGARGSNMGFQEKLQMLLSPNLSPAALRESATDIRKLMDIYARGGGRSVTQPALPKKSCSI